MFQFFFFQLIFLFKYILFLSHCGQRDKAVLCYICAWGNEPAPGCSLVFGWEVWSVQVSSQFCSSYLVAILFTPWSQYTDLSLCDISPYNNISIYRYIWIYSSLYISSIDLQSIHLYVHISPINLYIYISIHLYVYIYLYTYVYTIYTLYIYIHISLNLYIYHLYIHIDINLYIKVYL